jgi:hypothetical protein
VKAGHNGVGELMALLTGRGVLAASVSYAVAEIVERGAPSKQVGDDWGACYRLERVS